MKKTFDIIKFSAKVLFLLIILAVGWVFVNATNLVKGKRAGDKSENWLGPERARADVPQAPGGTVVPSTPFLACFDGKKYLLENDVLFGRPKSYWSTYEVAQKRYEDGTISPDLYKITAPIQPHDGKIKLQVQEIEPEESFFKWIGLKRIVHPTNTELLVDSELRKYYIIHKADFEKKLLLPANIRSQALDYSEAINDKTLLWESSTETSRRIFFQTDESIEVRFENIDQGKTPFLVMKSWYRDWVLGREEEWATSPARRSVLENWGRIIPAVGALTGFLAAVGLGKLDAISVGTAAALPFLVGAQAPSCSFICDYKDKTGTYQRIGVYHVRTWKYNHELIEIPRDAICADGTATFRVRSSKRHALGFIGLVSNLERVSRSAIKEEKLRLQKAFHSRIASDVASSLQSREGSYVQTIPGDTIDLEFVAPPLGLKKGEKETYLFQSSGFYTALRPESEKIAGNWKDKISQEAQDRLSSLVPLNTYQ